MSSPKRCCASGSRLFLVAGAIQFGAACPSGSRPASTPDAGSDAPSDTDSARMDGPGAADVGSADAERPGLCAPVDLVSTLGGYAGVAADGTGFDWTEPGIVEQGPLLKLVPPCVLRIDGTVTCGVLNDKLSPPGTFKTVAVGEQHHACGIHTDDTISCWENESSNLPMKPSPPPGTFTRLVAADSHFCGLRSDGQILCWEAPFLSGYAVPAMPLGTTAYANVTIGSGYVCGIKAAGSFDCWSPDPATFRIEHQLDLVADRSFVDIFFGVAFGCGLQRDGTVLCSLRDVARADREKGATVCDRICGSHRARRGRRRHRDGGVPAGGAVRFGVHADRQRAGGGHADRDRGSRPFRSGRSLRRRRRRGHLQIGRRHVHRGRRLSVADQGQSLWYSRARGVRSPA